MSDQRKKLGPSKVYYGIAVVFAVAGIVMAILTMVIGLLKINDHSLRLIVPASNEFFLEAGNYTVFHEYKSEIDGKFYQTLNADISELRMSVYDYELEEYIEIKQPTASSTYTMGNREGYSIWAFSLEEDAHVMVDIWYLNNEGPDAVLSIQNGFGSGLVRIILFFMIFLFGGLGGGGLIIAMVSSKRSKALHEYRRELKEKESEEAIKNSQSRLWQQFVDNRAIDETKFDRWSFGSSKEVADELVDLVLQEKKRATTSLYRLYEIEKETIPRAGEYSVILDGSGRERCIIQTSNVKLMAFEEVDGVFAEKEGEGDLSLDYWRRVHRQAFSEELKAYGIPFNDKMLVVLEEFKLVYK